MAEEQEDLNEFKRWDAVGATAFITAVPVVMCYVLTDHSKTACIPFILIAVAATLAVMLLTFLFSETFIGRVVNLVGFVLAPIYLVVAICSFWAKWTAEDTPTPAPAELRQQEGGPAPVPAAQNLQ